MAQGETTVDMAQRHVRQGRAKVARQQEIVAGLRAADHPAQLAGEILSSFQDIQAGHEARLGRLLGSGQAFARRAWRLGRQGAGD